MKFTSKINTLSLLILISFLFVGCTGNEKDNFKTFSGRYTIQYPSDWIMNRDNSYMVFSEKDKQCTLELTESLQEFNYLKQYAENNPKKFKKCTINNKECYWAKMEDADNINTYYCIQEKDMLFEMHFSYPTKESIKYESLTEQIKDSFKINDFASFNELDNINKYTSSEKINGNRDAKWLTDIEFLSKQLPTNHKNLFFNLSEDEFRTAIDNLKGKIASLTDNEIIVELTRLLASVGDGHTSFVSAFQNMYPIKTYCFDDEVYIIDSVSRYSDLIGCKLNSINDRSIEDIEKLFKPLIPNENAVSFKNYLPYYLVQPNLLKGLKIIDEDTIIINITDMNGEQKDIQIEPMNIDKVNYIGKYNDKMLYLKNRRENYWYEYLKDDKLLYFQYNSCVNMRNKPFRYFNKQLFDFIDNNQVNKIVVDLRNNGGGRSPVLDPFFDELNKRRHLDKANKLFVIVGRKTFSSAILNTLKFHNDTNATLVGEATSGKPNCYGEVKILNLVNTDNKIRYSTKYFNPYSKDIDSYVPSIIVEPSAKQYFNNIDPVMEKILSIK